MSLESATFISDLVQANPAGNDNASQGDDHLRLLKTVLQATLPNATRPKYFPNSGATKISSFSTADTDDDKAFQCDATSGVITITLSTTTIDGLSFFFQKIDSSSNAVVLDPTSTVLINGASTLSLSKQWSGVRVVWLNTYGAWLALPVAGVVPYYSGGQDIPFSDIAPSANAKRLLGAATATDFSEQDIATVLDWIGTCARGDIIVRGASAFARLALGSTKKLLQSDGTDLGYVQTFDKVNYPAGAVINRTYGEYTLSAALSTIIPGDDTIPQVSEGTEIISVTITPRDASSRIRCRFRGMCYCATNTAYGIVALFKDGAANAIAASGVFENTTIQMPADITLEFEHAPATASLITYSIRAGASGGNLWFNGTTSRIFGGASRATLVVEEIAQ